MATPDLYAAIDNAWMATALVLHPSLPAGEAWRAETLRALLEKHARARKSKARDAALVRGLRAFFGQSTDFEPMSLNLIFLGTLARQLLPDSPPPTPATAAQTLQVLLSAATPS